MDGTLVALILMGLVIATGISGIYIVHLRNERAKVNHRLKVFLKPSRRPWRVDKQMIIKEATKANSTDIVVYDPGALHLMNLSNPRFVRVCITNGSQIKLIGDAETTDEQEIVTLIAQAENECAFLNAHDVK